MPCWLAPAASIAPRSFRCGTRISSRFGLSWACHATQAQVVISQRGHLDYDALLFNVPDVPVFLIAGDGVLARSRVVARARPWIHPIPLLADNLRSVVDRLRRVAWHPRIFSNRRTIHRIATGRCGCGPGSLSRRARNGGERPTPRGISGAHLLQLELITKKRWADQMASMLGSSTPAHRSNPSGVGLIPWRMFVERQRLRTAD